MKAITLWQPWASLMACGAKKYETRSWPAPKTLKHGELVAIHAAARPVRLEELSDEFISAWCNSLSYPPGISILGLTMEPRGAVLAIAEFLGCFRAEEKLDEVTVDELMFGDWSDGRYVWQLQLRYTLSTPIPAQGKQGLWEWDAPEWLMRECEIAGARP